MVTCTTWMSEAPLVLSFAFQSSILALVSISPKCATGASGVTVAPEGGVAWTVVPYSAAPRTPTRRAHTHFDFISPPSLTRAPRRRAWGRGPRAAIGAASRFERASTAVPRRPDRRTRSPPGRRREGPVSISLLLLR